MKLLGDLEIRLLECVPYAGCWVGCCGGKKKKQKCSPASATKGIGEFSAGWSSGGFVCHLAQVCSMPLTFLSERAAKVPLLWTLVRVRIP